MILKIKNFQLETTVKVLNYPMAFQKGRVKTRFLKLLGEKGKAIDESRVEMLKTLADKDDKQQPIIEKGQYKLTPENLNKFNTEYAELMNEECLIDIPESMKADVGPIKSLILESTTTLDNRETSIVEEVYEALTVVLNEKIDNAVKAAIDKKQKNGSTK